MFNFKFKLTGGTKKTVTVKISSQKINDAEKALAEKLGIECELYCWTECYRTSKNYPSMNKVFSYSHAVQVHK